MNKKTKIIILISLCILIAIIGIYFLFPKGSNTQNIYVQKVSTIIGSSNTENRYSGVVESSETVDINSDGNKSITEMYVEAGQKVRKGDKLFSYDTTEASNSIAQKKLDIEAQNNEIAAQNNTIEDYKAELNKGANKSKIRPFFRQLMELLKKSIEMVERVKMETKSHWCQLHKLLILE